MANKSVVDVVLEVPVKSPHFNIIVLLPKVGPKSDGSKTKLPTKRETKKEKERKRRKRENWGPNQTAPKPSSLQRERQRQKKRRERENWGPNQTATKPSSLEREETETEKTGGQIRQLQNQAPYKERDR